MKSGDNSIRNIIMDAAIDVFSSGDFEQATMRAISEKAQVPTTTIYKYFRNKDDLYVTIISLIVDRTNSELNMHLTGLSSTQSKIYRLALFQLEFFESNPKIAYLVLACVNFSYWYQHEKALKKAQESSSVLSRIIREGQRKKEVRTDIDLHVVNHLFFGTLRAMVISWLYGGQSFRLSSMADYFADAIYGAIMTKTPPPPFICPLMNEPAKPEKKPTR
jgi:AcrR family transcriptional regulator